MGVTALFRTGAAIVSATAYLYGASTCEAIARAEIAFVGTVVIGSESDPDGPPRLGNQVATVRVESILRGLAEGPREVRVNPAIGQGTHLSLRSGQRWLFIGGLDDRDNTVIFTSSDSGSQRFGPESSEYLTAVVDSFLTGPNLVIGGAWMAGSKPVPGAEVTLVRKDTKWSGRTNASGRFEARGLPAGEYKFGIAKEKLVAERHTGSGFEDGKVPDKIVVPERGCVEAPVYLWPDTRVSGTVTSADGNPVRGTKVTALRLDKDNKYDNDRTAITGDNGQYSFSRLLPGKYVFGINAGRGVDEAYATTYHPASPTQSGATPVIVGDNGAVDDIDIRTPLPRRLVTMRVRVVWPDGRPAAGAYATLILPERPGTSRTIDATDAQGFASIQVFDGSAYEMSATWALWEQTEKRRPLSWHRADAVPFVGSPGRVVVLRLNEKSE